MEDYKPNSHKFKESQQNSQNEQKVKKVVNGAVTTKKKSESGILKGAFITEDIRSVGSYILTDVVIPSIKNILSDTVSNGINMLLFGEAGRKRGSSSSKISYSQYYSDRNNAVTSPNRSLGRTGWDYDEITFETRGDAERVLTELDEAIDRFGVISVGDLYNAAGVTTENFTVNKYGWTNIRSAEVIRVRDGYVIKMPKATPI